MSNGFVLTTKEFYILLAGSETKQICSFLADNVEIQPEEICYIMHDLYQSKLIEAQGETFVIEEELKKFIKGIQEATGIYIIKSLFTGDLICLYKNGNEYIATRMDHVDNQKVSISSASNEEYIELLQDVLVYDKPYPYFSILDEEESISALLGKNVATLEQMGKVKNVPFMIHEVDLETGKSVKSVYMRVFREKWQMIGNKRILFEKMGQLTLEQTTIMEIMKYIEEGMD